MPKKEEHHETVVNISFKLDGNDAKRFLRYMDVEELRINTEAGRRMMFQRLTQWEKENNLDERIA